MRQRFWAEKPLAFGCRRRMYSARAPTVPCPQPSAAVLRLIYSPMLQYKSISSLLTAATARPRAASISRSTSSKSADDGTIQPVFWDGDFFDFATQHLLVVMQLTIARRGEATSNWCYSATNKGVKSHEIDSLPLCFFNLPIRGVELALERSLLSRRLGG